VRFHHTFGSPVAVVLTVPSIAAARRPLIVVMIRPAVGRKPWCLLARPKACKFHKHSTRFGLAGRLALPSFEC